MAQQITGGQGGAERGTPRVVGKRVVIEIPGDPRKVEVGRVFIPDNASDFYRAAIDRGVRELAMIIGPAVDEGQVGVENIEYIPAAPSEPSQQAQPYRRRYGYEPINMRDA